MNKLKKSEYIILGLLGKFSCSGYELKRIMEKTASYYGSESNAQIYPVLKSLEIQNLVISTLDASSGKRQKKIFSITEKGLSELYKWLDSKNTDMFFYREDFLIKLSLGQFIKKEKFLAMIKDYKKRIIKQINELKKMKEHIHSKHAEKQDREYLLLTYEHLEAVLYAKLNWCRVTETQQTTQNAP